MRRKIEFNGEQIGDGAQLEDFSNRAEATFN
jgi:hypothetical protein